MEDTVVRYWISMLSVGVWDVSSLMSTAGRSVGVWQKTVLPKKYKKSILSCRFKMESFISKYLLFF